jgi:hypothetical protein
MKSLMKFALILGLLASLGIAQASIRTVKNMSTETPPSTPRDIVTLDDQCVIDFFGFVGGAAPGATQWPGGYGNYYATAFEFTNSCAPGETLFAYCVDLDHALMTDPYCVNIDPLHVNPLYPEQYKAMAYIMSWFTVNNANDDAIQQLANWKLSNDNRFPSPTNGVPFYHINDGRGYPNYNLPGVYPWVNTVLNYNPGVNNPANLLVLDALGYGPDGLEKNVILCDDHLTASTGTGVVNGSNVTVPVTIQLTRGAQALFVGNTTLGGVKLQITTTGGTISSNELFTNAAGQAYLTVTQPLGSDGVTLHICSRGNWPKSIIPCDGPGFQQLLVQSLSSGALCTLCVDKYIPSDEFLAAELANFEAVSGDRGINLTWRTASETNLNRWEVERREAGSANFERLTAIPAANVANGHQYNYTDASVERATSYDYRLVDVDNSGARNVHSSWVRTASWTGRAEASPDGYGLLGNYPNPFNPETRIMFRLTDAGFVTLKVYDVEGHEVSTLVSGNMNSGDHSATFSAGNLPSGIYFYTLTSGHLSQTRKMILMK